jgi:hypothetical protein
VIRAEVSLNSEARYAQLQVANAQPQQTDSTYTVSGSIVNTGSTNAADVSLVVTAYDADQHVVGYRQQTIGDGTLAAGASEAFAVTVSPDPSAKTVADYSIVAQGRVAQ